MAPPEFMSRSTRSAARHCARKSIDWYGYSGNAFWKRVKRSKVWICGPVAWCWELSAETGNANPKSSPTYEVSPQIKSTEGESKSSRWDKVHRLCRHIWTPGWAGYQIWEAEYRYHCTREAWYLPRENLLVESGWGTKRLPRMRGRNKWKSGKSNGWETNKYTHACVLLELLLKILSWSYSGLWAGSTILDTFWKRLWWSEYYMCYNMLWGALRQDLQCLTTENDNHGQKAYFWVWHGLKVRSVLGLCLVRVLSFFCLPALSSNCNVLSISKQRPIFNHWNK